jgi:hypothetical protein
VKKLRRYGRPKNSAGGIGWIVSKNDDAENQHSALNTSLTAVITHRTSKHPVCE